jgi:hypothetical protein
MPQEVPSSLPMESHEEGFDVQIVREEKGIRVRSDAPAVRTTQMCVHPQQPVCEATYSPSL